MLQKVAGFAESQRRADAAGNVLSEGDAWRLPPCLSPASF